MGVNNKEGKIICCENVPKSDVSSRKNRKNSEKNENWLTEMDEGKLKRMIDDAFKLYLGPFEKKIKKSFGELENAVQYMSDSFEEQKTKFEEIMKEVTTLRTENEALKMRVHRLEARMDDIDIKERATNLIIDGVPKQANLDASLQYYGCYGTAINKKGNG